MYSVGLPCQGMSTVVHRTGVTPSTRSGLWAPMPAAIERLQPELLVSENVRGLLSAHATRYVRARNPLRTESRNP